jgi:hypothetical protein
MNNPLDNKPWHQGINVKNQTLEWLPTDSKEIFDKLIQDPVHYDYFKQQGWLEPGAITYEINSEGFRCEEFDYTTPCMIALGCSYTIGIGLPLKDLWATLVGKSLGLQVYNLAWGGSSGDTCFRMAHYWISKLKPQVVCMLHPPRARIEVLTLEGTTPTVETFMPMSQSSLFKDSDGFLKHWFGNEDNHWYNREKNKLAVESVAKAHGAKYAVLDTDSEGSCSRDIVGYARDYMHTGPIGHQLLAEKFLNQLQ